jgi:hypothetical protein
MSAELADSVQAAGCLRDYAHVGMICQEASDSLAENGMVIDGQNPD